MKTILAAAQQQKWVNNNYCLANLKLTRSKNNVVRLLNAAGETLSTASGGGYDKEGTVLGEFIQKFLHPELQILAKRGYVKYFYGMRFNSKSEYVTIQGGAGVDCMIKILNAIGFEVLQPHDCLVLRPLADCKNYQRNRIVGIKKV